MAMSIGGPHMATSVTACLRRFGGLPFCFLVLAACGAATGEDAAHDSGPTPDADTHVCISHCTNDFECQSTCPAAPNMGINCCDVPTGTCFAATPGMCPVFPPMDAGMD